MDAASFHMPKKHKRRQRFSLSHGSHHLIQSQAQSAQVFPDLDFSFMHSQEDAGQPAYELKGNVRTGSVGWFSQACTFMSSFRQPKGRPLLLASLSSAITSQQATSALENKKKRQAKLQDIPMLVSRAMPQALLRAQRIARLIFDTYRERGEDFPRPCPVCGTCDFFAPAHHDCTGHHQEHDHSNGNSKQRQTAQQEKEDVSFSTGLEPVTWESRPLACEQCHRWWHMGCLGIQSMDQVPPGPWFHSESCRRIFASLEAEAERGEVPAWELGFDAGRYSVTFMTEADHRHFVTAAADLSRGDMPSTYELLSSALPDNLIMGFGSASAEYSGGKYSLLLCRRDGGQRKPVSVATFDVYGSHAAQLHLLVTDEDERRQGHASALLEVLEYRLSKLGVQRLVTQPRSDSLKIFRDGLGFDVMHPAEAALMHRRIPVAYTDAVILEKRLEC